MPPWSMSPRMPIRRRNCAVDPIQSRNDGDRVSRLRRLAFEFQRDDRLVDVRDCVPALDIPLKWNGRRKERSSLLDDELCLLV